MESTSSVLYLPTPEGKLDEINLPFIFLSHPALTREVVRFTRFNIRSCVITGNGIISPDAYRTLRRLPQRRN